MASGAERPVSGSQESSCEEGEEGSFYTAIEDEASEAVDRGPNALGQNLEGSRNTRIKEK